MTHYKVEIQLPLEYNLVKGQRKREKIPQYKFLRTHRELFDMAGGINTSRKPIFGAWKCPETGEEHKDRCVVYIVLVKTEDKMTLANIPKIKELKSYKKVLIKRFKQKQMYIVATRCVWL